MDRKTKIQKMLDVNSKTTSYTFYNPGYPTNPYFGASTFYGEQSRLFQHVIDGNRKNRNYLLPSWNKAIGRQLME